MRSIFRPGDIKTFDRKVRVEDCAIFFDKMVHPLYATFALARDVEWCCRLFVLEMIEDDEEGVGTFLQITHVSAAPVNTEVLITATLESIQKNEVRCSFMVASADKIIARGQQGQKILKQYQLNKLYESKKNNRE